MREIKNLCMQVASKDILRGIDLMVTAGEGHAIMGPNGSGKSTLARVLAGGWADGQESANVEHLREGRWTQHL